jgi:hypothetical protein
MLIRVFRATPKPGKQDELVRLIEEVSVPFVDGQPGLIGRFTGQGLGATGAEIVMISLWEDLDALTTMTGEDWESGVIPDARLSERIDCWSVAHYRAFG